MTTIDTLCNPHNGTYADYIIITNVCDDMEKYKAEYDILFDRIYNTRHGEGIPANDRTTLIGILFCACGLSSDARFYIEDVYEYGNLFGNKNLYYRHNDSIDAHFFVVEYDCFDYHVFRKFLSIVNCFCEDMSKWRDMCVRNQSE